MRTPKQKLQTLLQQLFRTDAAELDFGIYRIINYRRNQIQNFIDTELPTLINDALHADTHAENAHQQIETLAKQIQQTLGDTVLDADGNLLNENFRQAPLVQQYLTAKQQLGTPRTQTERADAVFNHLYTFFSRYYENGDFLPRRRYTQTQRYAIPYNGEEVYLHWANREQYYVKSGEHFTGYTFKAEAITVTFSLRTIDIEKDNVKGAKRFFIPLSAETQYRPETKQLELPFEHRPLTDAEKKRYGKQKQQEKILDAAEPEILANLSAHYEVLSALERRTDELSTLKKHLRTYTRRNTSDFFIHKALKRFLTRELDVYLKNEVIPLSGFILNTYQGGGRYGQMETAPRRHLGLKPHNSFTASPHNSSTSSLT